MADAAEQGKEEHPRGQGEAGREEAEGVPKVVDHKQAVSHQSASAFGLTFGDRVR